MKISVIICAYNEEKYISSCLKSIMNQIEKPYEIILVDNNSTDNTVSIAKKYDVRVIHEKEQGIIPARNTGFTTARGDIIARSDADSIIPPNWTKKIRMNFESKKIDALSGPIQFYDLFPLSVYGVRAYLGFMYFFQKYKNTMLGPNMVLTSSIWHKVKNTVCLNDAKVHEDIDLALHIHKAGGIIHIDNDLIVRSSARRIKKNPLSFFAEYPLRVWKTVRMHR